MIHALAASCIAALLLAAIVRAARPAGLLDFLGDQWQVWQIFKPAWLPDKPTGGCAMCTAFWLPGIPVAAAVAYTGGGWWALAVPALVGVVFEIAISK